jgi:beta-N-acetylhexosaminidase
MNASENARNASLKSIVQRCILGFDASIFEEGSDAFFLADLHPLGYIFFRHHFDDCASLDDVRTLLDRVKARHPHPLFLGLDQEGGQVERLPSRLFHGGLSPFTIGEVERLNPETELAKRYYDWQSQGLASVGFNLNFFPTLDAHLNSQNPIIGNRAFSSNPSEIKRLGKLAIEAQSAYGIQSVLKHYPGHGNGTVDSHLALPTLDFTEAEESSFVELMQADATHGKLPWVMLAHGTYPHLQEAQTSLPASCDKGIVTDRLRDHWGFKGITITDDLNMHGLLDAFNGDQVQASLTALNAGVDVLLFREAGHRERLVVEALATALVDGRLDVATHEASVARLNQARTFLNPKELAVLLDAPWHQAIDGLHNEAVQTIFADFKGILNPQNTLVLEPHASMLPHYAMEYEKHSLTRRFLPKTCTVHAYDESDLSVFEKSLNTHNGDLLAIVWLPHVGKTLLDALEVRQASSKTTSSRTIILNIGTPLEGGYPLYEFINLGTARPITIQKTLARLFS